jgi:imidazolonepropionase-like amidohydrolase
MTHPRNTIDFTQPHEPAYAKGRPESAQREYEIGCANWKKARARGVPMMTGTDTGFAVTPYGEWHARELELFVDDLGFTPAAALRTATETNARFVGGGRIGVLEAGHMADFVALDASPLADIGVLQDKSRIRAVHIGGKQVEIAERCYDPRQVTDFALSNWTDLYTRERVRELRGERPRLAAAE